jgi:hypothetical protein
MSLFDRTSATSALNVDIAILQVGVRDGQRRSVVPPPIAFDD